MARGGKQKGAPFLRTCIGCGEVRQKRDLVRVVAATGTVSADLKQTAAGRGAYVCPSQTCAEKAVRQLGRAFKTGGLKLSAKELWGRIVPDAAQPDSSAGSAPKSR